MHPGSRLLVASLLLLAFLHRILGQDSVILEPNPWHVIKGSNVQIVGTEQETSVCFYVDFVSDWTYTSSGWTGVITIGKVTGFTGVYPGEITSSTTTKANFRPTKGSFEIDPAQTLTLKFCVSKSKSSAWSAIATTVSAELTMWIGDGFPSSSVTSGTETKVNVTSNQCFPSFPSEISNFTIFTDSFGPWNWQFAGRIMSVGDVTLGSMKNVIASMSCPTCSSTVAMENSAIVSGGKISWPTSVAGVCGGLVQAGSSWSIASNVLSSNDASCPEVTSYSAPISFTSIKSSIASISNKLNVLQTTGLVGYSSDGEYITQLFGTASGDFLVFDVDGSKLGPKSQTTRFYPINTAYFDAAKAIVINISGKTLFLHAFNGEALQSWATKVVFNFYEATSLTMTGGQFFGMLVAPKATISATDAFMTTTIWAAGFSGTGVVSPLYNKVLWELSNLCYACDADYYGASCSACNCAFNYNCDDGFLGTGVCTCKPEWNDACTECDSGRFGNNCQDACTESCLAHGTCSDGLTGTGSCSCKDPWGGDQCDECKAGWGNYPACDICDNGHYGDQCQFACTTTCAANGICSHGFDGTGECLSCGALFVGSECEACKDESTMFGSNCAGTCSPTCLSNGACSSGINGTGTCSCNENFSGTQCEYCSEKGLYGKTCSLKCADSCLKNGVCDDGPTGTGSCLSCSSGYTGVDCEVNSSGRAGMIAGIVVGSIVGFFASIFAYKHFSNKIARKKAAQKAAAAAAKKATPAASKKAGAKKVSQKPKEPTVEVDGDGEAEIASPIV